MGIQKTVMLDTPFTPFELHVGDIFLLCSDGLTSMIDDPEIEKILGAAEPETVCRKLVDVANQSGGRDNVTVVVAKISEL